MGTITVTTAGFGALPAQAPAGWPSDQTWPGNGTAAPNGSVSTTMNDADFLNVFVWAGQNNKVMWAPNTSPSIAQVLTSYPRQWWNGTISAVQRHFTSAPTVPPPISMP